MMKFKSPIDMANVYMEMNKLYQTSHRFVFVVDHHTLKICDNGTKSGYRNKGFYMIFNIDDNVIEMVGEPVTIIKDGKTIVKRNTLSMVEPTSEDFRDAIRRFGYYLKEWAVRSPKSSNDALKSYIKQEVVTL